MPRLPLLSGVAREHLAAEVGLHRRARDAARAEGLHERAAVRLLVVGDPHHEDLNLDAEERAGKRERRSPLSRRRSRSRSSRDAGFLVVEGLRDGRVRLVAAGRAHAFVLVVDARRRLERLLEASGAEERARAPLPVHVADRLRNLDLALGRDLLHDERHRKERREVVGSDRLERAGMQHRRRRRRQVGHQVVPVLRDARFVEQILDGTAHGVPPRACVPIV